MKRTSHVFCTTLAALCLAAVAAPIGCADDEFVTDDALTGDADLEDDAVTPAPAEELADGVPESIIAAPSLPKHVSNRYVVILKSDEADPGIVADQLTRDYGGTRRHVYSTAIKATPW